MPEAPDEAAALAPAAERNGATARRRPDEGDLARGSAWTSAPQGALAEPGDDEGAITPGSTAPATTSDSSTPGDTASASGGMAPEPEGSLAPPSRDEGAITRGSATRSAPQGALAGPGDDEGALAERLRALGADPGSRPLLVALDLDGTLAPLRDDPMTSRVVPGGEAVMARLAATRGVHLALVSGRAMGQLPRLVDLPPGTLLVGSHGAERARVTATGLDRDVAALSDEQADALATLGGRAAAIARGRDGVWVESKPAAVVVHTRLAPPDVARTATAEALALAHDAGIRPLQGKDVVELPVLDADKGAAVAALRDELGAARVLYAGDDVTDEHALAVLAAEDVGIKVGPGSTHARYRVSTPDALVAALTVLADALG